VYEEGSARLKVEPHVEYELFETVVNTGMASYKGGESTMLNFRNIANAYVIIRNR